MLMTKTTMPMSEFWIFFSEMSKIHLSFPQICGRMPTVSCVVFKVPISSSLSTRSLFTSLTSRSACTVYQRSRLSIRWNNMYSYVIPIDIVYGRRQGRWNVCRRMTRGWSVTFVIRRSWLHGFSSTLRLMSGRASNVSCVITQLNGPGWWVNSWWPNDAIWCHRIWSTLVQV